MSSIDLLTARVDALDAKLEAQTTQSTTTGAEVDAFYLMWAGELAVHDFGRTRGK